jgi:DNA transformation protein
MALSKDFEAFAAELFAGLGPVRIKRMFGGAMVYAGEYGFALLDDEAIWIKVDDANEAAFVEAGAPRFTYPAKDGKLMEMAYRRLPETAMDDADEALGWARLGLEAAMRAVAKKPAKPKTAKARRLS